MRSPARASSRRPRARLASLALLILAGCGSSSSSAVSGSGGAGDGGHGGAGDGGHGGAASSSTANAGGAGGCAPDLVPPYCDEPCDAPAVGGFACVSREDGTQGPLPNGSFTGSVLSVEYNQASAPCGTVRLQANPPPADSVTLRVVDESQIVWLVYLAISGLDVSAFSTSDVVTVSYLFQWGSEVDYGWIDVRKGAETVAVLALDVTPDWLTITKGEPACVVSNICGPQRELDVVAKVGAATAVVPAHGTVQVGSLLLTNCRTSEDLSGTCEQNEVVVSAVAAP